MKAIISAWKTLTDSLGVVGRNRRNWFYPLLALLLLLLVTFTVMIPLLARALGGMHEAGPAQIFFFLVVYGMYGVLYFVITFCHVALLHNMAAQLDGTAPLLSSGLSAAMQRSGPIARYTLVSSTKGLISLVAKTLLNPVLARVVVPVVGKQLWQHWRQLSSTIPLLMALPVIALEPPAAKQLFKRSEQLVKTTWGDQVKPAHSINLLSLLTLLPILLLLALPALQQGTAEHNTDLLWRGLSIMLVAISSYTQLSALVNAIFALAAYRYATTRKSDVFPGDPSYAEHAFVKSQKTTEQSKAVSVSLSDSPSMSVDDCHL